MLTIIVPTYNERENLPKLMEKIFTVLGEIPAEAVVVDDNSPDGTGQVAEELKERYPVRVIHRKGRRGFSSAVMEGIKAAQGDKVGLVDADMSHDIRLLPRMLKSLEGGVDIVIGSRYVKGGGTQGWPFLRRFCSWIGCQLAKPISPVRDSTTGFVFFKRSILDGIQLTPPPSSKIGLEILVKGNYSLCEEIPYTFVDRLLGKSKFNSKEVMNYLKQLLALYGWVFANAFSGRTKHRAFSGEFASQGE